MKCYWHENKNNDWTMDVYAFLYYKFISSTKYYNKYSTLNMLYIFAHYMRPIDYWPLNCLQNAEKFVI